MKANQCLKLGKKSVQELWLHVQVGDHPLAEHLLDHLEQLAVVLLCHYELINMLLSFRLMWLQCRSHSFRDRGSPGFWLLFLYSQEWVCVQISQGNWETLGKLLRGQELRVEQVLSVTLNILSVLRRFTKE